MSCLDNERDALSPPGKEPTHVEEWQKPANGESLKPVSGESLPKPVSGESLPKPVNGVIAEASEWSTAAEDCRTGAKSHRRAQHSRAGV